MPFKNIKPVCQMNLETSNKPNRDEIEKQKEARGKILERATFKARDNLTLWIFQQMIGQRKYGEALEQQLELMWQEEVSTFQHDKRKKSPQIHTRIHLADTDYIDLIQGEFEGDDIPTKWDAQKKKQVPMRITPKMVISYNKGYSFREHVDNNWLPDGLSLKTFWAKDKNGDRINWAYDCVITRVEGSHTCDWDEDN